MLEYFNTNDRGVCEYVGARCKVESSASAVVFPESWFNQIDNVPVSLSKLISFISGFFQYKSRTVWINQQRAGREPLACDRY